MIQAPDDEVGERDYPKSSRLVAARGNSIATTWNDAPVLPPTDRTAVMDVDDEMMCESRDGESGLGLIR